MNHARQGTHMCVCVCVCVVCVRYATSPKPWQPFPEPPAPKDISLLWELDPRTNSHHLPKSEGKARDPASNLQSTLMRVSKVFQVCSLQRDEGGMERNVCTGNLICKAMSVRNAKQRHQHPVNRGLPQIPQFCISAVGLFQVTTCGCVVHPGARVVVSRMQTLTVQAIQIVLAGTAFLCAEQAFPRLPRRLLNSTCERPHL